MIVDNTIILGDCLEVMKQIPDKSIDLCLSDPPYGTTACEWDKVVSFNELWKEIKRVTKNDFAIMTASQPFTTDLINSNRNNFKYEWIWHKNLGGGFALAKKQPLKRHENILVFYNHQPTYNPQMEEYSDSTKKRFKQGEMVKRNTEKITNKINNGINYRGEKAIDYNTGTYPTSVKFFKRPHIANGASYHPTQKPVSLWKYLLQTYSKEGDTILDPFAGSGTTAIACHDLKRNFICIEKEPEYHAIATDRYNTHKAQLTLF